MKKIILTESVNPDTINIDLLSSREILEIINNEDIKPALSIKNVLNEISTAVDLIADSFQKGGRLLYFGAGTSGRLGVLDASECPPTFSVESEMVQGFIAGGDTALRTAVEGAEDSFDAGENDLLLSGAKKNDVVVGISASGNAIYVQGVLSKAKQKNISTIGITCNKEAKIKILCDIFICPEVGSEVIGGSTRLKAGTAHKMVLNMLSTASMIRIGKTYKNFMVDVRPTNIKLKERAARIVSEIAEISCQEAEIYLQLSNYRVKHAVIIALLKVSPEEAGNILLKHSGRLREALKANNKKDE